MSGNVVQFRPPPAERLQLTLAFVSDTRGKPTFRNVLYDFTGSIPPDGNRNATWQAARGLIADLTRLVGEYESQEAYLAQQDGCEP